ncbi:MAG: NFACT family protein [Bacilli bacterium]|jgi:predicted ribosome quality control (RQC) complex YloA/Tae2 family protein|nr:NFACT family protein [Bacilli bacterium]MDD3349121.1 NFACT family protein [Bacilli bacterium]MDD4057116.1 NFACT family protein [Bacilli bacterium]MDY0209683.1 NFACT family protein [Bacilli bacterium]
MNIDGVFLHHLLMELKPNVEGCRINKVLLINDTDFILSLSNRKNILISANNNSPHLRMTKSEYMASKKTSLFYNQLKAKLENSIINSLLQINNDRLTVFEVIHFDELGYQETFKLYFEIYGRNANIILTNAEDIIIESYKRNLPNEEEKRIIIPKTSYHYLSLGKLNPFLQKGSLEQNNFEGVSNLTFTEMAYHENQDIINQQIKPTIMEVNNKSYFYCFPLIHLHAKTTTFASLSEMLEFFYINLKNFNSFNSEQTFLENHLKKEINKSKTKLAKQEKEYEDAINHLEYEKTGNLLATYLHKVNKGDLEITVDDFYLNGLPYTIKLDPLLTPTKNLESIFNKYKKAKRTIVHLEAQMETTKQDIEYYICLLEQLNIAKANDIKEIYEELKIKKIGAHVKKITKPNITTYQDSNDNIILVGKNNLQNNYLTHKLASKNDYFFHVQGSPGSHTILKANNPSPETINLAAQIAAYYSKSRYSSNVAVDYTLVRNVKKVPGTKGSFVLYANQKTVFVTPNHEELKKYLKN